MREPDPKVIQGQTQCELGEILGREELAVDRIVVIVSTVVMPSDTRAGDASRWRSRGQRMTWSVRWSRGQKMNYTYGHVVSKWRTQ